MSNNEGFSVLSMAQEYADDNDIDVADLFKQTPAPADVESEEIDEPITEKNNDTWTPDDDLIKDMPELNTKPRTYSKDELTIEPTELKNIVDETAKEDSKGAMDDLIRKHNNIESVKKRFGIKHLQVPEGPWHVKILTAASDPNTSAANKALDEIFTDIVNDYPEFVMEWEDEPKIPPKEPVEDNKIIDVPKLNNDEAKSDNEEPSYSEEVIDDFPIDEDNLSEGDQLKVIINKTDVPEIGWDSEDVSKIKKAREVELVITEDLTLRYNNIVDVENNAVDAVLSKYTRKVNDVSSPLPASNYRATFTGLTYPEVLDLTHSSELNTLDGERKKWSIAFDHIKNQSIGPWREYSYYINPTNNEKIEIPYQSRVVPEFKSPSGDILTIDIVDVSKFDDFLMKTDYLDIEWILWKVACATAMDSELITINCHAKIKGNKKCNASYDWIYSPNDLLVKDSISVAVLDEMKKTAEVESVEEIEEQYRNSMLNTNNTIELPTSKFGVVFGHISAYEYLNNVYGEISSLDGQENVMVSDVLSHAMLTVIKAFLIPGDNGQTLRFTGVQNILKCIESLDEFDWVTLSEVVRLMIDPYRFQFSLMNLRCPKCGTKSNAPIEDMSRLLFIIAQSLSSVHVELKRT